MRTSSGALLAILSNRLGPDDVRTMLRWEPSSAVDLPVAEIWNSITSRPPRIPNLSERQRAWCYDAAQMYARYFPATQSRHNELKVLAAVLSIELGFPLLLPALVSAAAHTDPELRFACLSFLIPEVLGPCSEGNGRIRRDVAVATAMLARLVAKDAIACAEQTAELSAKSRLAVRNSDADVGETAKKLLCHGEASNDEWREVWNDLFGGQEPMSAICNIEDWFSTT